MNSGVTDKQTKQQVNKSRRRRSFISKKKPIVLYSSASNDSEWDQLFERAKLETIPGSDPSDPASDSSGMKSTSGQMHAGHFDKISQYSDTMMAEDEQDAYDRADRSQRRFSQG